METQDRYRCEDKRIRSAIKEITAAYDSKLANKPSKRKYYDQNMLLAQKKFNSFLLENVVDVDVGGSYGTIENVSIEESLLSSNHNFSKSVRIFEVKEAPTGLYILRGLLTQEAQYNWTKICLKDFSLASHTNISNLHTINNITKHDIQSESSTCIPADTEQQMESISTTDSLKGLRWASLGYHYNWTLRMYEADQQSVFPTYLSSLCRDIASLVGLDLTPEAAIVNYYPLNGQMSGHLDDAEHNMNEPIISLSLGCSAIFLIGGRVKSIKPIPILLHSGDVIIMSDEARYCYHGIPVIIPPEYTITTSYSHNNTSASTSSSSSSSSCNFFNVTKEEEMMTMNGLQVSLRYNHNHLNHASEEKVLNSLKHDEIHHNSNSNDDEVILDESLATQVPKVITYDSHGNNNNHHNQNSNNNNSHHSHHNQNNNQNNNNSNNNNNNMNNDTINDITTTDKLENEFIRNYLRNGRINVNVRRVTRNDGIWEKKNGSGYSPV